MKSFAACIVLSSILLGSGLPASAQGPVRQIDDAELPGPQRQFLVPPPPPPPVILRYERRRLRGLAIAGGAILGGSYLLTAAVTGFFDNIDCTPQRSPPCGSHWPLYIPVIGPFVDIGRSQYDFPPLILPALLSGLAQVAGLTMLVVGLTVKRRVPVYAGRLMLMPVSVPRGGLLTLGGPF